MTTSPCPVPMALSRVRMARMARNSGFSRCGVEKSIYYQYGLEDWTH